MTRLVTSCALALVVAGAAAAEEAKTNGRQAFDRLKGLAGEWQGTAMTKDGPPAAIRYEVVSGGTTVMERLFPGSEHEMISMFHLEGDALVLTHYCALGNQPRMRLDKQTASELSFAFDGGTNFDPKKDPHIHSAHYLLTEDGRLEAEYAYYQGEKPSGTKKMLLTRRK